MIEISDLDLGWLAGLLEGEGSFWLCYIRARDYYKPVLSVTSTDYDVIERAHLLLGLTSSIYIANRNRQAGRKEAYIIQAHGKKALFWMNKLYPLMGKRRKEAIDDVLSRHSYIGIHEGRKTK